MKNSLLFSQIKREHLEEVIVLLQNLSDFQPPKESYDEIWRVFNSQPNIIAIVAIFNSTVIGFGSVVIETKIRGGKIGHIEDIVVHPLYNRRGIGKKIINELYKKAQTNQCYKVVLVCRAHNITFYEKCGFENSGSAMQRLIDS